MIEYRKCHNKDTVSKQCRPQLQCTLKSAHGQVLSQVYPNFGGGDSLRDSNMKFCFLVVPVTFQRTRSRRLVTVASWGTVCSQASCICPSFAHVWLDVWSLGKVWCSSSGRCRARAGDTARALRRISSFLTLWPSTIVHDIIVDRPRRSGQSSPQPWPEASTGCMRPRGNRPATCRRQ